MASKSLHKGQLVSVFHLTFTQKLQLLVVSTGYVHEHTKGPVKLMRRVKIAYRYHFNLAYVVLQMAVKSKNGEIK